MTGSSKAPAKRRPPKKITIREIAREAGVSTATVSRALNRPDAVSARTRDRVNAVIKRHHFVFDGLAGGLASRRSRTLGLVIPTITNSIYASSTQAIQRAAQAAGYSVLVGIAEFSPSREATLIHRLLERRVEGLILTGEARSEELYEKIAYNGVPFVITWKLTTANDRPSVSFDNRKAARAAIDHLVALGHRKLALICGRTDLNDRARDRRLAFEEGLAAHGIEVDPALIFERSFEFIEGRTAMHRILNHPDPPTAVFCANDIQAIGALHECHEVGVRVPQEMSIIGFDDLPVAQYVIPQLTTIRVPAAEMGLRATEGLIAAIDSGEAVVGCELPTDLILRDSAGPPTRRDARGRNGRGGRTLRGKPRGAGRAA